jgi:predicted glycoside hydrolase/deacetylase ChbG (UPF0249 family)
VRTLIVNADDLGHSEPVNAGIAEAHEQGIVTSASLMVRRAAAEDAALYARTHPRLSVGLHVDLGEWVYRDDEGWIAVYDVDAAAIEQEVRSQLDAFRSRVGHAPTHLDSHQHVHRREPARSAVLALGETLGIPVRHFDPRIRYCGEFYGQTDRGEPLPDLITPAALVRVLETLPGGITELCCHPASGPVPDSSYDAERGRELVALCDQSVRRAVAECEIRLASFAELRQ